MSKLYRGRKRRTLIIGVIAALALPAAAFAAWIIYTGLNGSGSGSFGSATSTLTAVTITGGAVPNIAGPGDSENMPVTIQNNAPKPENVLSVTGTVTSTPSDCASHLTMTDPGYSGPGTGVAPIGLGANGTFNGQHVVISADGTLPDDCQNGSYTVTFSGTTSG